MWMYNNHVHGLFNVWFTVSHFNENKLFIVNTYNDSTGMPLCIDVRGILSNILYNKIKNAHISKL